MQKELYIKFLDMLKQSKRVKRWQFSSKAKELVKEKYPDESFSFKLSHRWFEGFCRYRISLRRKIHVAQKSPAALRNAIEKFRTKSLRGLKR